MACHQIDGALVGPLEDAIAPHPTAVADLRAPTQCAHCHQLGFDFVGHLDRPIIDTYTEWNEYRDQGGDKRCADCHMPAVEPRPLFPNGPVRPSADHRLRGPYDPEFVKTGAVVHGVELTASRHGGATAAIDLGNETGHRLPSAEPQRSVRLRLIALDDDGREVSGVTETLARPVDVIALREAGPDTTMSPLQRRTFALQLPGPLPAEAVEVAVVIDFYLWDPQDRVPQAAGLDPQTLRHRLFERRQALDPA